MSVTFGFFVLVLLFVKINSLSYPYKVHHLEIAKNSKVGLTSSDNNTVYCHERQEKTIEKLWWTLEIYIGVQDGIFHLYTGGSPRQVYENYKKNNFKLHLKSEVITVDPFNTSCVFIESSHTYHIQTLLKDSDNRQLMVAGIILIFAAKFLSKNTTVFYISAILFGMIFAKILGYLIAFMLIYFIIRRSVMRSILTVSFGALLQPFGVFDFEGKHILRYILATGFLSFLVAYWIGPPTCSRSKNVIMWAIQGVGVTMIVWSTWHLEAATAIAIIFLGISKMLKC